MEMGAFYIPVIGPASASHLSERSSCLDHLTFLDRDFFEVGVEAVPSSVLLEIVLDYEIPSVTAFSAIRIDMHDFPFGDGADFVEGSSTFIAVDWRDIDAFMEASVNKALIGASWVADVTELASTPWL